MKCLNCGEENNPVSKACRNCFNKMKNKICKCGHEKVNHWKHKDDCSFCPCKKFEAQSTPPPGFEPGSDNSPLKRQSKAITSGLEEDTLSSKMFQVIPNVIKFRGEIIDGAGVKYCYEERDIKEFIKKLKEELYEKYNKNYSANHNSLCWNDIQWKIDKLAGAELLE